MNTDKLTTIFGTIASIATTWSALPSVYQQSGTPVPGVVSQGQPWALLATAVAGSLFAYFTNKKNQAKQDVSNTIEQGKPGPSSK